MSRLPWLLSPVSICSMILTGKRLRSGWALTVIGQLFWIAWAVGIHQWALLPLELIVLLVALRNWRSWGRDDRSA